MKNQFEAENNLIEEKESSRENFPIDIILAVEEIVNKYSDENNLKENIHVSEAINKKFGDIVLNISNSEENFSFNELSKVIKSELGQLIISVQELGDYLNIVLDKKIIAKELVDKDILRKNLSFLKDSNYRVEFGHLNLGKPQNVGQLRNFFTGKGMSNILTLAGANVESSVVINDIGVKASKLFLEVIDNWQKIDFIFNEKGEEYYCSLNKLINKNDDKKDAILLNQQLSEFLKSGKKEVELFDKISAFTTKNLNEMKVLWENLGITIDIVDKQSQYEKKDKVQENLAQEGFSSGLFYEKEGLVFVDVEDIQLGQHVLIKRDGTSTYIVKDLVALISRLSDKEKYGEYICVGPSLFDHYDVVYYVLNKLYPGIGKNVHIIRHQLSHADDETNTDLYSFLKNIKTRITPERDTEGMTNKDIINSNLFYQNIINNLNSHVNINIEKFLKIKGDSGTYILYTINRFNKLIEQLEDDLLGLNQGYLELKNVPNLSKSEDSLLIKFIFFKKKVERAINKMDPSSIYREFMVFSQLLNSAYHEMPKLRDLAKEKNDEEIRTRIIILKKLIDDYKYIFSVLFN